MNRTSFVILLAIATLFASAVRADVAYYPLSTDEAYLVGLLESDDEGLVSRALYDLRNYATAASLSPVLALLRETETPFVIERAADVLKHIGDASAAPGLRDKLLTLDRPPPPEPDPETVRELMHSRELLSTDEASAMEEYLSSWRNGVEGAARALADALVTLDETLAYAAFEELIRRPGNRMQLKGIYRVLDGRDDAESLRLMDEYVERCLGGDIVERGRVLVRRGTDVAGREYLALAENPETPRRDELLAVAYPRKSENGSGLPPELWDEYLNLLGTVIAGDPDPGLRIRAAWLLFQRASDEERDECERVLKEQISQNPDRISQDLFEEIMLHHSELALFLAEVSLEHDIPEDRSWVVKYISFALLTNDESARDLLTGAFRSEEPSVRAAALRCMAYRPEEWAPPYFLEALNDPSPGVRWEAADILKGNIQSGRNPAQTPGAFEAILAALEREDNPSVYEVLTLALGATKDPRAVPVLVGIYEDADPADEHTRGGMLYILRYMYTPEADAALADMDTAGSGGADWLRSIIYDPSPEDLGIIRERCLNSPDPEVRRLGFLIYIDSAEAPDADLLADRLARDPDASVRETIASGMARKHLDVPTESLVAALNNENSWKALESLSGMLENHAGWSAELEEAVLDKYHRLLAEPPSWITEYSSEAYEYERAVVGLLGALMPHHPETAFSLICDYMDTEMYPDVKSGMVRLLADYDHPDCVAYLKSLLRESPLVGVQLSAMGALDKLIGAGAADDVAPLLESEAGDLPWNAASMLCKWGDVRGLEYYLAYFEEHGSFGFHNHFSDIARVDDPRAEALLFELVEKPECRLSILQALGERHDRRAEEYLAGAVESGDSWEVAAAFSSLCRMKSPLALVLFGGLHARAETSDDAYNLYRPLAEDYGGPEALELLIATYREMESDPAYADRLRTLVVEISRIGAEADDFLREVAEGEGEMAENARRFLSRLK